MYFINTGVKEIFPNDRDFLWDQSLALAAGRENYMACPPKNCEVRGATSFESTCNQNIVAPSTNSPGNG